MLQTIAFVIENGPTREILVARNPDKLGHAVRLLDRSRPEDRVN